MKFGKQYSEYLEKQGQFLKGGSYVEFKRHKKLLKRCFRKASSGNALPSSSCHCPSSCTVCDGNFFPNLLKEISEVVGFFNARAQQLSHFHLATKLQRFILRMKNNFAGDHTAMIEEGRNLVNYASMNAIAIRKILKKYDKVHHSVQGRAFRRSLQAMHAELLQSPWLIELCALYINLKESSSNSEVAFPEGVADCSCRFEDSKATLHCSLVDSQTVEVDLTCSICLETMFEPVALGCGHIFCNSCACTAASIPTIEGLKFAKKDFKCPLCRQDGVYRDAVLLTELNLLLKNRCKDYWHERLKKERVERVQQSKEHWENQLHMLLGM